MSFTSLTSSSIANTVLSARRRVVLLSPAVDDEVADAIASVWPRLGPDKVTVIVDADPEVFRLGYGTLGALERLQAAAQEQGAVLCTQPGVRLTVLIVDDFIGVAAPQPKLLSEEDPTAITAFCLNLNDKLDAVVDDLGAGPSGEAARSIGLDGISTVKMDQVKNELSKNPPQRFDLARQVRVFNAAIEFVELEVKGCQVSRKEVTLPADLIAIPSDDVRRRLRPVYKLIDRSESIAKAQTEVDQMRREVEQRFLRVIPGFGMAMLGRDRELFARAMQDLQQCVALFKSIVESEIEEAIKKSVEEIAAALSPAIRDNPTEAYRKWSNWQHDPSADRFVRDRLKVCFDEAAKSLKQMSATAVTKGVTYQSLQDPKFLEKARKAFPELDTIFNEFDAARAQVDGATNG